jgi:hypothetical protein
LSRTYGEVGARHGPKGGEMAEAIKVCIDRALSIERLLRAAQRAMEERPENAPMRAPGDVPPQLERVRMAILTEKKWEPGRTVSVSFLDGDPGVQSRVKDRAQEWSEHGNIRFDFADDAEADIRISFQEAGSWSYLGTDALGIDAGEATMNYGWLTPDSDDEEVSRVVLHEFGHALGCIHEHQHPEVAIPWDKEAVYSFYAGPPNNWSTEDVDHNLFQAYGRGQTQFSKFDRDSIMLYAIPDELTIGAYSVGWNRQLSETDKDYIGRAYRLNRKEVVPVEVNGEPTEASVEKNGEEDQFSFRVQDSGTYVVETSGPTDVVMAIFGPDTKTRAVAEDDDSGADRNAKISTVLMAGEYLIRVRHYSPTGTGAYQLSVRREQ